MRFEREKKDTVPSFSFVITAIMDNCRMRGVRQIRLRTRGSAYAVGKPEAGQHVSVRDKLQEAHRGRHQSRAEGVSAHDRCGIQFPIVRDRLALRWNSGIREFRHDGRALHLFYRIVRNSER